ncbi:type VII secretion protein EssC [Listeria booriae]|uniref:type VII secretion protein EssC n=1 Tax=Listeria booriae TaxID=1552123 RepID=UPI0021ADC5F5|nr:type VII secretion protein EssC [Listeria booriae]
MKLYLFCEKQLYKQNLEEHRALTISSGFDGIYIPESIIGDEKKLLAYKDNQWQIDDIILIMNGFTEITTKKGAFQVLLIDEVHAVRYEISRRDMVSIGSNDFDDIQISSPNTKMTLGFFKRVENFWTFEVSTGVPVYHNEQAITSHTELQVGDYIHINGIEIIVFEQELVIKSFIALEIDLPYLGEVVSPFPEDYPNYRRSPRIIYRDPVNKVTILQPSQAPQKPSEQLGRIIIPPVTMLGMTILMTVLMPTNGLMRLVGVASTAITSVFSIVSYINNRKKFKVESAKREKTYHTYLGNKAQEISLQIEEQKHARNYHFPTIETLTFQAARISQRIFEKTIYHHDYLEYRVGVADARPSFEIVFDRPELEEKKDPLIDEGAEVQEKFRYIPNLPVSLSLANGAIGYVGSRPLVLEQLQLMLAQIAFFHSYHDVEFVTLFPIEEKEQWDWMRWLPHASLKALNTRGFVYHDRSRDQILTSLYQILKDRKQANEESGKQKLQFAPHYIITVTDEKFLLDHSIMELLTGDPSELGVSLVFVEDVIENLSEHVKTVVDIRTKTEGNIVLIDGELVNQKFVPDHFPLYWDKELLSRSLAPLNHVQSLSNTIPEKITFLGLYNVRSIEELEVAKRWEQNTPHKSLAVPLGLRGKDDIVYLNLHEKAHGPHGLVAGTTGSGKSEIIQSYILSLAVNFHPYEVAFLLIDYKGGGMANLFKNLPHHLGSITNLDGAQSMRALISIKAELQRRQRLFSENEVNHINQYQKLFKAGTVSEPMPHLFLISDEFAELKAEQPEFMKELVSTARIGRSLGIHLILATQKPSGVVDDQIWSNSKFKLALKVQNASDSNEILKTPDAANITLPGRAYLQVGNNEIYELFQSAWSGADYMVGSEDSYRMDDTIYAINELGQYEILTEDLSGLDKLENTAKVSSELEAIIDYLDVYTTENKIKKLPQPWLPPLPKRLTPIPVDYLTSWQAGKKPLIIEIGMLDQPEIQAQNPFSINLSKDGHLAIFSSPTFGKSTMIQTVIMQLARYQSPELLHVYLLDFGTNGLMPLKHLPHVADLITGDEQEKLGKFTRRIFAEQKRRKSLLSDYGVANLDMYEKLGNEPLPEIIVVLDNYDVLREPGFDESLEQMLTQIGREGASLGIHLITSASRTTAMKYQLLASIKLQVSLFMIDKSEVNNVVGRSDFVIEEIHGRGLIKLDKPTIFQTTLPVEGEDDVDMITNLQAETKAMNSAWVGNRPALIPMVPEVFTQEDFLEKESVQVDIQSSNLLPLGVDYEDVESVAWNLERQHLLVLMGGTSGTEVDAMHHLLHMLHTKKYMEQNIVLFDNRMYDFGFTKDAYAISRYASVKEEFTVLTEALKEVAEERMQANITAMASRSQMDKDLYYPLFIFVSSISTYSEYVGETSVMETIMDNAARLNMYVILGDSLTDATASYASLTKKVKTVQSGILFNKYSGQNIFNIMNNAREPELLMNDAYIMTNGKALRIRIPIRSEGENNE